MNNVGIIFKKIFIILFSFTLLSSCEAKGSKKHEHKFELQNVTEEYLCKDADCTHPATYYYSCECGEHGSGIFNYGKPLGHSYTQKVADKKYLLKDADCEHSAVYYYSCQCGECGTETFEYGDPKGHKFNKEIVAPEYLCSDADCTHAATYYYSCECGEHGTETFEVGSPLGHKFDQKVTTTPYLCDDANCVHPALYYYSCHCGECGTETFEYGSIGKHSFELPTTSPKYNHNIVEIVKYPTNVEDGVAMIKCSCCEELFECKLDKIAIENYIVVPYIESTGNETINTGYCAGDNFSARITMNVDGRAAKDVAIFGDGWNETSNLLSVYQGTYIIRGKNGKVNTSLHVEDGIQTIETTNKPSISSVSKNKAVSNTLFGIDGYSGFRSHVKLYSFEMYESGAAVRAYVPVINSLTGEAGLYDLIEKSFYSEQRHLGFVLPEGYSSEISVRPSNESDGVRTVKYPGNPEGFELNIPKIDENLYRFVDCIESQGYEFIDSGLVMSWVDKTVLNMDYQILHSLGNDYCGANYYLQLCSDYIKHYDRTNIKLNYSGDETESTAIYDGDKLVKYYYDWGVKLENIKIGFFKLGQPHNDWWNGNPHKARIYSAEISIHDRQYGIYQPAYDVVNKVYGLYDLVTNKFFKDASDKGNITCPHNYYVDLTMNGNTFSYFNKDSLSDFNENIATTEFDLSSFDSENYQRVTYLESVGEQYINTHLYPKLDYTCEVLAIKQNSYSLFGAGLAYYGFSGIDNYKNYAYIGGYDGKSDIKQPIENKKAHVYKIKDRTAYIDDIAGNKSNSTVQPPDDLYIFARSYGHTPNDIGHHKIFYFKLWDEQGNLVFSMLPAIRNIDNKAGLYDLVSKEFFVSETRNDFRVPLKTYPVENFKKLSSLSINDESYIDLGVDYFESYEINADSYDGKKASPIYDLGYKIGGFEDTNYSTAFELKELTLYRNKKVIHHFIPVERTLETIDGLYDTVTKCFHKRILKYPNGVAQYYFPLSQRYNTELANLIGSIEAAGYIAEVFMNRNRFDVLSYYEIKSEEVVESGKSVPYHFYYNDYFYKGEFYNLYWLDLNGTYEEAEWISNCELGNTESGFHEGFENAANFVLNRIENLIVDDPTHNKLIISGFSRGAAAGSIITAKLSENPSKFLSENIVTYALACPNYSTRDVHYDNIHHICNPGDIVTKIPLNAWGFYKEGNIIKLPLDKTTMSKMNEEFVKYQVLTDNEATYGIPVHDYNGFNYDITNRVEMVGELVSAEKARDPQSVKLLLDAFSSGSTVGPDMESIMKVLELFNTSLSPTKLVEIAKFALEVKEKVADSHDPFTYASWLRAMYGDTVDMYTAYSVY